MAWMMRMGFGGAAPEADAGALLRRVGDGDRRALELLYRRESGPLYRYALALGGDEAAALDAVQDAFGCLIDAPQAYDARRGSVGAYLAGIARHRLLAQWRHAGREIATDDVDGDGDGACGADPQQLMVRAQDLRAVHAAIRRLAWAQREALVLVDLQERAPAEAAAIAGVDEATLRQRLHRARRRLARLLGSETGVHP